MKVGSPEYIEYSDHLQEQARKKREEEAFDARLREEARMDYSDHLQEQASLQNHTIHTEGTHEGN